MARFILVTFAFLGWAFYEMSGGNEFEPASARLTNIKVDPLKPVEEPALADASKLDGLEDQVTRVALNLNSVEDVLSGTGPRPAKLPQQTTEAVYENVPQQGESVAIIQSLVDGADASNVVQVSAAADDAPYDVRSVSANRVNVRGGPGTDYNVVSRLVRGDEVEILEDSGNGWVLMRPMGGGETGWMADFLLTDG